MLNVNYSLCNHSEPPACALRSSLLVCDYKGGARRMQRQACLAFAEPPPTLAMHFPNALQRYWKMLNYASKTILWIYFFQVVSSYIRLCQIICVFIWWFRINFVPLQYHSSLTHNPKTWIKTKQSNPHLWDVQSSPRSIFHSSNPSRHGLSWRPYWWMIPL